jgi:aspartate kinase
MTASVRQIRVWPQAPAQGTGIAVCKYGGSSLATVDRIRRIASSVAENHSRRGPGVVVVSARGDTTDELLADADHFGGARTTREADQLLATGECASAAFMAMAITEHGAPAVSLTGSQAGIAAAGKHGEGVIAHINPGRILSSLQAGTTVVVAGFQGINENEDVITLGRGGSDTTAVALAAALRAAYCEIYTDVAGVFTADPRMVPDARPLAEIPVGVMAEMAFAGAKVLHSRAVELAAMYGVELRVADARSPDAGTWITGEDETAMFESQGAVVAVAHDTDVARVLIRSADGDSGLAADVLGLLSSYSVPVDLVARSGPQEAEFRMGFTMRRSDLGEVRIPLERLVSTSPDGAIRIDEKTAKISLIGVGLLNRPGYTAQMLSALAAAGISTSWISTSQLRSSAVIPLDRVAEAVLLLHREFGLGAEASAGDRLSAA